MIDAAGNPVEGVRIGLVRHSGQSGYDSGIFTKTDNNGRFAFKEPVLAGDEVEKQSLSLVITKDGYAGFDSRKIALEKKASPLIDLATFTLQPAQSCRFAWSTRTTSRSRAPWSNLVTRTP